MECLGFRKLASRVMQQIVCMRACVCVCGGGNWGGEVKQELTLAALGIKGRFGASVFWENNLLAQIVLSAGFISSLPKWRKECHSGHRL